MASILKVDALQGITSAGDITVTSEGGAATQSLQQGLAKAWINFNGTGTIAQRDSFNVSSLTDAGTGKYAIAFSSAMLNDDYAVAGQARNPGALAGAINAPSDADSDQATGSLEFVSMAFDTNNADRSQVHLMLHGDLA